jgi:large subunit ribosomal protein L22
MADKARRYNLEQDEARAVARYLRISPQKLNLVAKMIRGMNAAKALEQLMFSKKRIAGQVRKTLLSAVSNAENNHGLDIDKLFVKEAYVGKTLTMKRGMPAAKGSYKRIVKPFSRLTVVVKEKKEEAKNGKEKGKKAKETKAKATKTKKEE